METGIRELTEMRDAVAEIIEVAAKNHLLPNFLQVNRVYKDDGSIVTKADLDTQAFISQRLQQIYPNIAFLGEEMSVAEQEAQLARDDFGVWCLDPLDGTSNFASGFPFFAISLALIRRGEIVAGWVYDPVRQELFTAIKNHGAWLNGVAIRITPQSIKLKQCLAVVDFKRLKPELITRLATDVPYASQRSLGSVALDWCWLALQRYQVYLHGRQKIWDYGAGWLIFSEAGGFSCTLTGDRVFTNKLEPRSAVAAGQQAVYDEWRTWLKIN